MGVAERKEREKQARREAILDAARECFFEHGFENATISQIADTVELSTGTLYLYFKNKEEIYVSILEEGLDILFDLMKASERPNATAREILDGYANAYYKFYTDYGQYFDIIFFLRRPDKRVELDGDLQEKLERKSLACLDLLESAVRKGIAEGDFRDVSPYEASRIMWGAMNGLMLIHEKRTDEITRQKLPRLIEVALSLLLDGIHVKKD
jgi:AcrR family transcriptional regulator